MRKLPEVQEAIELMNEAIDWSFFKWMFEKARVRETADRANDALDRQERTVKAHWSAEVKAAFGELSAQTARSARQPQKSRQPPQIANPQIRLLVEQVKAADDAARRARRDAEKTFDLAERELSKSLAQEGCRKAIHCWELHEKAIRKAAASMGSTDPGT